MLQRSISKLSRLCVNQDAKIATIRATLVAALLAGLLLVLMNMSSAESAEKEANFTTSTLPHSAMRFSKSIASATSKPVISIFNRRA